MTAHVARYLTCDGLPDGEVCDAELMADDGVDLIYTLRRTARDGGWVAVGDGHDRRDYCPDCRTPDAPHPAPCRFPSSPDCTCGGA